MNEENADDPDAVSAPSEISKEISLKLPEEWISVLRNGKDLNLELATIDKFLKSDLKVESQKLHPALEKVLPAMVAVYINKWSDCQWDMIQDKNVNVRVVAEKLYKHLETSVAHLIDKEFREALRETEKKNSRVLKPEASFKLKIECPSKQVNSLCFTMKGDDMLVMDGKILDWPKNLTTTQLIHFPTIQVDFESTDLSFSRKMDFQYVRTITLGYNKIPLDTFPKKTATPVECVENKDCSISRRAYTCRLLAFYARSLITAIQSETSVKFTPDKLEEVKAVLQSFIDDVRIAHFNNSIATNTGITVLLTSTAKYLRVKKPPKRLLIPNDEKVCAEMDEEKINFSEVIIPKLDFCLKYFKGIQANGNGASSYFISLKREYLADNPSAIFPKITYKCTFCNVMLHDRDELVDHLQTKHTMEDVVYCKTCKRQFTVFDLTKGRWQHKCHKLNGQSISID